MNRRAKDRLITVLAGFALLFALGLTVGSYWLALSSPTSSLPPNTPFLLIYTALTLGLSVATLCSMAIWGRQFDPTRRGTVEQTPAGVRVRLYLMFRWAAVLFTLVATLLVTPFLCGVTFDNGYTFPERWGVFPTWAVAAYCGVIGVGVAFRAWRSAATTGFVLDDQQAGTVSWHYWNQEQKRRSVSRAAITAVSVRKGGPIPLLGVRGCEVVLHWQIGEAEPHSEAVVGYSDPADAEALAGWIRGRLGLVEGKV
jgi:hypothetical protein